MLMIHQIALYFHVAVGVSALFLFWVPVLTRKGSLDHRRFGRWFARVMYVVALSGLLMASMDLWWPLAIHAAGVAAGSAESAALAGEIRERALFLLSLSILVLATTRHGWLVILHRDDRRVLRRLPHRLLCLALFLVGVVLLAAGIRSAQPLYMIFGAFEIWLSVSFLHYIHKPRLGPREWWIEHLGGLIGSGIGAYTAFFVFGGSTLLESIFRDSFSSISLVLWVAPGVLGGAAIVWLSRHYRRRFERPSL